MCPAVPSASAAPPPPAEAEAVFTGQLALAVRYAELLATTGISHGLVGPREGPRLWERHLVNCAVMESLLPQGSHVIDIGSGAGLPGVALAIARPDLQIDLVEPLRRRTQWLSAAVADLGLDNVRVHRGRAQEMSLTAPFVTARAVASLDKLMHWSFPLLEQDGRLLALKGAAASRELADAQPVLRKFHVKHAEVLVLGDGVVSEPVRVIDIQRPVDLDGLTQAAATTERVGRGSGSGEPRRKNGRKRQSRAKASRMRSKSS